MLLQPTHKRLLREQLRRGESQEPVQRKRRKTRQPDARTEEAIVVDDTAESNLSSDELEDVDLDTSAPTITLKLPQSVMLAKKSFEISADVAEVDDFDDLEDVDLDQIFDTSTDKAGGEDNKETLTFTLAASEDLSTQKNKKKRAFIPILKEERIHRKLMHKLLLMTLICHGAARNKWCNDPKLMEALQLTLPRQVVLMFHQDNELVLDVVKARKFIDGLRTVMLVYAKKFKVTFQGLSRPDWKPVDRDDMSGISERAVSLNRFRRLVRAFQGSRDIQAHGLVALLRAIGVNARLVFCVQVPDHKSLRPTTESSPGPEKTIENKQSNPNSEFDPVFIPTGRQNIVTDLRFKASSGNCKKTSVSVTPKFPVFWAEVWNKYSKKWITVDPAVFKVVEVQPMRRKGKFEAPMAEESFQTWYVLAYDRRGVVKDVTRRYTQYYNAKTVKRRIGFDSDDDQHWYEQALLAVSRKNAVVTQAEAYEMKEFRDRHICEGIPNNMADFKNHPVYALESQLRQDEVIYPNDDTSKCGTFRLSNKNSTIPIYKRSHVFPLKTPKAWYMKGRVLKVGARPLKTKPLKSGGLYAEGSADLDDEIRLYAEFQTELFRPPPIVNGIIEKNAYGNVEIFTPTMMPDNGYLARVSPTISIKMLEKAAKYVLKIDYAKAIVSFDFGGSSKSKRTPTATEGGILIDKQYREALDVVLEALQEEEAESKRHERELSALKYWNFFLKKLQIMHRLDQQHGTIHSDDEVATPTLESNKEFKSARTIQGYGKGELGDSASEAEDSYSVGSDDNSDMGDNEEYIPRHTNRRRLIDEEEELFSNDEGGFIVDLPMVNNHEPESDNEGGGFFIEPENESDPGENIDNEVIGDLDDQKVGFVIGAKIENDDRQNRSNQDSSGYTNYNTKRTDSENKKKTLQNSQVYVSSGDESHGEEIQKKYGNDTNASSTEKKFHTSSTGRAVMANAQDRYTSTKDNARLHVDHCQGESTKSSPSSGGFRLTAESSHNVLYDQGNKEINIFTDSLGKSLDITHTELDDGITGGSTKPRPEAAAATSSLGENMLKSETASDFDRPSIVKETVSYQDIPWLQTVKGEKISKEPNLQTRRSRAQNLHENVACPADDTARRASNNRTPVPHTLSGVPNNVITISSGDESGEDLVGLSQEKLQQEIQKEEAELGLIYSDTD